MSQRPVTSVRKYDDVIELCRDRRIDLLCLTETWHDADSAVLGRLRRTGYNVVDRPRLLRRHHRHSVYPLPTSTFQRIRGFLK